MKAANFWVRSLVAQQGHRDRVHADPQQVALLDVVVCDESGVASLRSLEHDDGALPVRLRSADARRRPGFEARTDRNKNAAWASLLTRRSVPAERGDPRATCAQKSGLAAVGKLAASLLL